MKKIIRWDTITIDKSRSVKTSEGFIKTDAVVTRTGIFLYSNNDGTIRKELRHPDDVFKSGSLKTMDNIPVTLTHPKERVVTSDNSKDVSVGSTGENARPDGVGVRMSLVIRDKTAVDSVESGKTTELSLGYSLNLDETPGVYENQKFDARQTDIEYNHLALVERGRAGNIAKIVLDHNDGFQVDEEQKPKQKSKQEKDKMPNINIDNINYEAAQEVINSHSKLKTQVDSLQPELTTAKTTITEMQAKLDTAIAEVKTLKEKNNDEEIRKGVEAKMSLIVKATPYLDEETIKKIDTMSNKEIQIAAIKSVTKDAVLDEKDDVYITARFDAVVEMVDPKNDSMSNIRQTINKKSDDPRDKRHVDSKDARNAYIEKLVNRHNPSTNKGDK